MKIYSINIPGDREHITPELNKYEMFKYPAGEIQVRLKEDQIKLLEEAEEIRITSRITDGNLMETALLSDAIHEITMYPSTLILPYLPYARADRRFVEGDCLGLRVFGRLIDDLGHDRVVTIDAHSHHARKMVSKLVNISPDELIKSAINVIQYRNACGENPENIKPTILLPDEGAVDRYKFEEGVQVLNASKVRDEKTGKLLSFSVPDKKEFKSNCVLIVDDICDGGGTFIGIADAMKDYKFDLNLWVTHGIFSKGIVDLKNVFESVFTSDSYPTKLAPGYKVSVIPTEKIINDKLKELGTRITQQV